MLGRLRRMFAQPGFAVLVAALGLVALNWPFLQLARAAGEAAAFAYLFGVWGAIIAVAFLISRALADDPADAGGEPLPGRDEGPGDV